MTTRDDKTGLPLLGQEDKRPIRAIVKTNGNPMETLIADAETGRVMEGVSRVEFVMTPEGSELRLAMVPMTFMLELVGEKVLDIKHPPKQIIGLNEATVEDLRHGEIVVALDDNGLVVAALQVMLIDQVKAEASLRDHGGPMARIEELLEKLVEYEFTEENDHDLAMSVPFQELRALVRRLAAQERLELGSASADEAAALKTAIENDKMATKEAGGENTVQDSRPRPALGRKGGEA